MKKPLIIAVTGPTASGKTSLAIELSQHLPIELINMDSAQVYRDMDIGSAKISPEEQALYPHHLIDIISPEASYSAAQFVQDVSELVPTITARGNIPLVVGGSLLYYQALTQGLADLPEANEDIRQQLRQIITEQGHQALQDELQSIDPHLASQIQGKDTQRLIRFVEIARITQCAPSKLFAEQQKDSPFRFFHIAIMPEDRANLHQLIAQRFKQMLAQGFLEEVTKLRQYYNLTLENQSMRCVGYRQAWLYQDGEYHGELSNKNNTPYDEMCDRGIFATRQLAKRQLTWLRKINKDILINDNQNIDLATILEKIKTIR